MTDDALTDCAQSSEEAPTPPAVTLHWHDLAETMAETLGASGARMVGIGLTNGGWTVYAAVRLPCGCLIHGYAHAAHVSGLALASAIQISIDAHDGRIAGLLTDALSSVDAAVEIEAEIKAEAPKNTGGLH